MDELLAKALSTLTIGGVGIWSGVLMFAAWWLREWRETRKLTADDRLARREGYAKQVEMLMKENRSLGDDLSKLRHEYDDYRTLCHAETDGLRKMVIRLEGEVEGYKRRADGLAIELAKLTAKQEGGSFGDHLPRLLDHIDRADEANRAKDGMS